ncbi:hypothetical protein, partial [Parahaliea mediterranea]
SESVLEERPDDVDQAFSTRAAGEPSAAGAMGVKKCGTAVVSGPVFQVLLFCNATFAGLHGRFGTLFFRS